MNRYFFHIAYKGNNYRGWQRQKNVITIQEIFEKSLKLVLKEDIPCLGCGRTDAGVHAAQYFFHINVKNEIKSDLVFILNKMLPKDIAVFDIIKMSDDKHAQFSATERTYDYFIHTSKDPFLESLSSFYLLKNLDIDKMKKAASLILNYSDFRALCKTPDKHNNTICDIKSVKLFVDKRGEKFRFQITANKFLKSMIRILVYRLLEIGEDKLSIEEFEYNLKNKKELKFINLAYPQGLYLSKIAYPFLDIKPRAEMFAVLQNDWQLV